MTRVGSQRHGKKIGNDNNFSPPFIIQSVHYKTINTTYVVEPKILHYSVHVLQSNIPMNILQPYVHISV